MTLPEPHAIVVVEDHCLFADALLLGLQLNGYDACRVPLEPDYCSTGRLVGSIMRFRPRTVVLDLELGPQGDGMRLVEPLALAGASVVVVTGSADRVRWGECLRHGARKVIGKGASFGEISDLMRRLEEGLPVLAPTEREELLGVWRRHQVETMELRTRLERLTRREAEVLGMLMAGQQVSEIALVRCVSESTVRTQVKAILAKLQVNSQLAAVGLANRARWNAPTVAGHSLPSPQYAPLPDRTAGNVFQRIITSRARDQFST